ncbi:hypothetical protein ACLK17_16910 [Escherichia coli]
MGYQLTGTAQVFADARTYWSPEAIERVTGHKLRDWQNTASSIRSTLVLLRWTVPATMRQRR